MRAPEATRADGSRQQALVETPVGKLSRNCAKGAPRLCKSGAETLCESGYVRGATPESSALQPVNSLWLAGSVSV